MVLLKAILVGFFTSIPVGPVAMLCIQNSLVKGFRTGIAVGIGAAIADAFYAFLIVGWLSIISALLLNYQTLLNFFGGFILIYIGFNIIKNASNAPKIGMETEGVIKNIISAFFLTLANPATILFFAGIFTSIGLHRVFYADILMIILGIFIGSLLWWVCLAGFASRVRHKIAPSTISKIKKFSGSILILLGIIGFSMAIYDSYI